MTAQGRPATAGTEPVAVDTVVTGEWVITLNADREIYRDGAIAVSGGIAPLPKLPVI